MKEARYIDAYEIAVDALTRLRDPGSRFLYPVDWWFIMRLAVDSLEQLPSSSSRESLILRARNGPEPFTGYDVAYTFCTFARWRYADVWYNEGFDFAALASSADSTWGQPDVLLGRSELIYGRGEGYQHFIRAVSKEAEVVHEVLGDPAIRKHNDLLRRLEASEEVQAALRASPGSGAR